MIIYIILLGDSMKETLIIFATFVEHTSDDDIQNQEDRVYVGYEHPLEGHEP